MPVPVDELIEKLRRDDPDERRHAANALGEAAQEGQDISAASEALQNGLEDHNHTARVRTAWALALLFLAKKDLSGVNSLIGRKDDAVTHGAVQALQYSVRKGTDIVPLLPVLEKILNKTKEGMLKGSLVDVLATAQIRAGMQEKSSGLLKHREERVRYGAAAVYRGEAWDGRDISPSLPALREALDDSDGSTRRAAAEALVHFHAQKQEWKEIDDLLEYTRLRQAAKKRRIFRAPEGLFSGRDNDRRSEVRHAVIDALYRYVTRSDFLSELPHLIQALDDKDAYVRKGVAALLRSAAEEGRDISSYVPHLKKALEDVQVRESAELALKTYDLKKNHGKRCPACLDCELGVGPGQESESFESLARIVKEMYCCAGELSQTLLRCNRCKKYFLSSYYDHTGFHAEQHEIDRISRKDAAKAVKEIEKCEDPENARCNCPVHKKYMKNGELPIRGERKYSVTLD